MAFSNSEPWLLILDNANNPEMDISGFLPAAANWHILITTRNACAQVLNTVGYFRFLGMDPRDATTLLLRLVFPDRDISTISQNDWKLAGTIASELGCLALALKQAATAIRQNLQPLKRYLPSLLGYCKALLSRPAIQCTTDANIIATWELPFKEITHKMSETYQDAVGLVHMLAFFHFASVPANVFSRSSDGMKGELSKKAGKTAVSNLIKCLGTDDPLTLTATFNLARTHLHLGEYAQSYCLLGQVFEKRMHFFGADHPETLMVRNELGVSLCAQKQELDKAEHYVQSALEARKRVLGEEHAYTLWSINDLSKIYCEVGRFEDAARILEEILPVVTRTLGDEHVGLSMTKSNLCRVGNSVKSFLLGIPTRFMAVGAMLLEQKSGTGMLPPNHRRMLAIADLLLAIYQRQGMDQEIMQLKQKYPQLDDGEATGPQPLIASGDIASAMKLGTVILDEPE
ncbi:hypothetical protein BDW59DRAFT_157255 [Aspergillus cavernicola]|uniref:Uncharacterized protein n=1 Tax=Aspergillus cavernicola TaxID=176166 RepID=A0ABR4IXC6_9EURO